MNILCNHGTNNPAYHNHKLWSVAKYLTLLGSRQLLFKSELWMMMQGAHEIQSFGLGHQGYVRSLAWLARIDGSLLASGGSDGTVRCSPSSFVYNVVTSCHVILNIIILDSIAQTDSDSDTTLSKVWQSVPGRHCARRASSVRLHKNRLGLFMSDIGSVVFEIMPVERP